MSGEEWRVIPSLGGIYEASSLGRVRSLDHYVNCRNGFKRMVKGLILKPIIDHQGYLAHNFTSPKRHQRRVHLLVLESFHGARPEGLNGCHNDGDKTNNSSNNLRWDTQVSNMADRVLHGNGGTVGRKIGYESAERIRAMKDSGATFRQIAACEGVSVCTAWRVVSGRTWNTSS